MEIWKTLSVSHIPTPPAATTDRCPTRRYTNPSPGTKTRSGHVRFFIMTDGIKPDTELTYELVIHQLDVGLGFLKFWVAFAKSFRVRNGDSLILLGLIGGQCIFVS